MHNENASLSVELSKKNEENRQLAELVAEMERRMKKAQASSKASAKFKKESANRESENQKLRKALEDLTKQNESLATQNKDLRLNSVKTPISQTSGTKQARVPSASASVTQSDRAKFVE